jgi:hypothetical protein
MKDEGALLEIERKTQEYQHIGEIFLVKTLPHTNIVK